MKTYQPLVIKREFKSIPFERAVQLYRDAADMAEQTALAGLEYMRRKQIQQLEKLWSDSHEAPYEGNFSDEYNSPQLSKDARRELRGAAGQKAVLEFVKTNNIDKMWTWLMPQLVSYIATLPPVAVEGKISGLDYIKKYFFTGDPWHEGLYRFLMIDSRSCYLTTQYKGEAKNFCSLVPLIMYAHKFVNNIPYSAWKRDEVHFVVNESLAAAMLCEVPEDLSNERLLEIREQGLTWKSGKDKGSTKDPISTYKLYGIKDTELGHLPDLATTMLTQIWCAHPSNRTKYMILDPKDWDAVPPPLVSVDIFKPKAPAPKSPISVMDTGPVSDLPWEL
jgi:hypothetical protein